LIALLGRSQVPLLRVWIKRRSSSEWTLSIVHGYLFNPMKWEFDETMFHRRTLITAGSNRGTWK
jgi:hypothetical protein